MDKQQSFEGPSTKEEVLEILKTNPQKLEDLSQDNPFFAKRVNNVLEEKIKTAENKQAGIKEIMDFLKETLVRIVPKDGKQLMFQKEALFTIIQENGGDVKASLGNCRTGLLKSFARMASLTKNFEDKKKIAEMSKEKLLELIEAWYPTFIN